MSKIVPSKITLATDANVEELTLLVNSAYRGDSSRAGWTTEADLLGGQRTDPISVRKVLADPNRKILCLWDQMATGIEGCVFLEKCKDQTGEPACHLGMLTVKPLRQDQGLGKALLNEAEIVAKKWGAKKMYLDVIHLRETLIAWYERRGYRRTGETKPFPYEDPNVGEPVREDLYLVTFAKKLG